MGMNDPLYSSDFVSSSIISLLSVSPSVCVSTCQCVCQSLNPSVRLPVCPSVRPSAHPSVRSCIHRSAHDLVRRYVCLSSLNVLAYFSGVYTCCLEHPCIKLLQNLTDKKRTLVSVNETPTMFDLISVQTIQGNL